MEAFQAFGYTVGCPGCDQLQIGGPVRRNYNDMCRDRIEAELSKTDNGKIDLDKPRTDWTTNMLRWSKKWPMGLETPKMSAMRSNKVRERCPQHRPT